MITAGRPPREQRRLYGAEQSAGGTFFSKTAVQDNAAPAVNMVQSISKPEPLAFLYACTFNVPCVMALTTTYRESHSLKWTARVALFYIGGALVLACIVYHIAALFL